MESWTHPDLAAELEHVVLAPYDAHFTAAGV